MNPDSVTVADTLTGSLDTHSDLQYVTSFINETTIVYHFQKKGRGLRWLSGELINHMHVGRYS